MHGASAALRGFLAAWARCAVATHGGQAASGQHHQAPADISPARKISARPDGRGSKPASKQTKSASIAKIRFGIGDTIEKRQGAIRRLMNSAYIYEQ
ncbi:hypothetical protein PVAP13_7NG104800 [Panicum virgatum]|uniref:Secreted protein n=1 Tax=Panicum virgatum TaxID=38727 RepID=A0A8T0PSW4_PANVG|nr:hypothetical protein PVAP13_7NG104800 [Panicum virgatum]KAG2564770.1 hypothetical protein PVAP13_7NG104800 [Panicum virgatum]